MPRGLEQLRTDARAIWQAGVDRVRADRLVRQAVRVEGRSLHVGPRTFDLDSLGRIAVVGAGKASAAMAAGLEQALGEDLLRRKQLVGWVNVPADCLRPLARIHLHPARPPGVNEPTAEAAAGSQEILRLAASLTANDLCLALISGGGSALLPAPIEGVSLADKLAVTRQLSAAGANIRQLNAVRRRLSRIKGGGLARACGAGELVALIISDVPGDDLEVIASGPTVPKLGSADEALDVLNGFGARAAGIPQSVWDAAARPRDDSPPACRVTNLIVGNLAMAVDAAGLEAERRGYSHAMVAAREPEGLADDVGRHLAQIAARMRRQRGPDCLVSGGEPVVRLAQADQRGRGGRNQQLVLAALSHLGTAGCQGIVLLSGGTDGEDGPTDAAGGWIDADVAAAAERLGLDLADTLRRNDAYAALDRLGALVRCGPTGTNVGDLRIVVVDRRELGEPGS